MCVKQANHSLHSYNSRTKAIILTQETGFVWKINVHESLWKDRRAGEERAVLLSDLTHFYLRYIAVLSSRSRGLATFLFIRPVFGGHHTIVLVTLGTDGESLLS